MKALILAAGLGTRLLPFTVHTPKPLFTLNQRPILDRTIEQLHRAGCNAIMVNTHHLHERIEACIARQSYPISIRTCHEPVILGTGGAIRNVSEFWSDEPLLIVNADIVTDIDLARVYQCHCQHRHAVTMVMHDQTRFNSVWVDPDAFVAGFSADAVPQKQCRLMAFTGIHVVDRRVLDFLPAQGAAHIIDAYARMLASGEKIKALIAQNHYWQDIGTPESYKAAVFEHMVPAAFERTFGRYPTGPIAHQPLQGDGSDRRWHRYTAGGNSLIMVDHGIRAAAVGRQEVDAFVDIGRHLHASGAPVPEIHLHDTFSGVVFLQDFGDVHLQDVARDAGMQRQQDIYIQVIDRWLHMAVEGGRHFDPQWTYQSPRYDKALILERECRYFVEAFLNGYVGEPAAYDDFADEFETLADRALQHACVGFMHRDLQSRNIMMPSGGVGFIDFQGGRLGPLQYDLASLLIDPYVALPAVTQDRLKEYAAQVLQRKTGVTAQSFLQGYDYCALTRNLQMLGAFAFLSRVKGKRYFAAFIPQAITSLLRSLSGLRQIRLPRLLALARRLSGNPITHKEPL
jgi:aminoglycoside/choline kinase family phosphotransferase/dTDP-glucose pyrophosphorylase